MPSRTVETFPERTPLEATRADLAVLVAATFALGFIIKRGDVCGEIAASGKLRRRTRTVAAGTGFAVDSDEGEVADASVFKVGDVLKNAAGAVIGTVQALDLEDNIVTLAANAAVAVAAGAAVLGSDGSQVAVAISDEETDGLADANAKVFIGGFLTESKLRGLDASAKSELGGVSTVGDIFKF